HDVHGPTPGLVAPEAADIERLIAFAEAWDLSAPMAIHCFAGVSRSTASAFVVACALSPGADELSIAMAMRRASPEAFPNRRIVALADDILDRRGRMAEAVEAMGGNGFISEGVPFALPARH
ncbi:MAG: tyrosine phosphatase family protein, partial [Caulobacteraceae bacterium]